ncbi:GNAT family N-acetyltransferase [Flavobacterium chuncheonense]|uniref:GNAT family N-acetyltransferase n=1 Tax=Flavobacterium chuncheonense TaxID=2026653 RepID=A0ABW5YKA0_9FLAO
MLFTIRPYEKEDCAAILDIINYNILHSTALYDYNTRSLAQQSTIFEDNLAKGYPIIVAINPKNEVVGFGYFGAFRFREAYQFTVEHSVYVHPDFQGHKIGHLLLSHLIELAKTQKRHTMIAVIDSENQGSVAFHEKFGFTTVGIIKESGYKFDRWLDSVFMQLML